MKRCPKCQKPLSADAPSGICPACLMGMVRPEPIGPPNAPTLPQAERGLELPPPADQIARHFPQLRDIEFIGQGGMGAVYKANQPNLDRAVAIKILSPRFAMDPSFAERFSREARTLARLTHQNIINVYDFGQQGDLYYLVMEYVDGVNLREAMRAGAMTPAQALAIVPQVCEALQYAHDEGIIHRDIKPENILIDRKGRVKIADFGLAKMVEAGVDQAWTLTGSRQVLGTLNYMAPEQIEQPSKVDHRADIYSLGVVLYELLTGELPLGRFPLPSERGKSPADLDHVVLRTLEKEPDRRYQRASEVRTAVESAWAAVRPTTAAQAGGLAPPAAPAFEYRPGPDVQRSPRVAFSVVEPHLNLMITHGVMRINKGNLEIDYSAKENIFKSMQLKSGQHVIPLRDVLSMTLKKGWFSSKLEMGLDRPLALSGIPNKESGKFALKIELSDHVEAWRLVNAVREANGQPLMTLESTGYVERKNWGPERNTVSRQLRWPALGLITSGVMDLLCIPLVILAMALFVRDVEFREALPFSSSVSMTNNANADAFDPADFNQAVEQGIDLASTEPPTLSVEDEGAIAATQSEVRSAPRGPTFAKALKVSMVLAAMAWGSLGVVLVLAGMRMFSLINRPFCFVASVLACVPLHPGFVIGGPFGIWGLIVLSRTDVSVEFRQ
ncbi:MAG TPA: serine/threonine-protein kinase [Pirellulaceae bacterium]|nr:serine/threonine-protein kinase [Pirellulaceae bacterium]